MYSFENDYSEGAHQNILDAMVKTNLVQTTGYGMDIYCKEAREIMMKKLGRNDIDIHFVPGGTQANLISISAFIKPYEAVIATHEGHIYTHEAGSIEATGHKVISVYSQTGKLTPDMVIDVVKKHEGDEHMVRPKLVYLSNSTEIGTIYTKKELLDLRKCCDDNNLLLFMDGARLAAALTSKKNDIQFNELCDLFDAFYVGATKMGALLGEAIVIVNDNLKPDFRSNIKQRGALFAKGKIMGIQFIELFKDDLYFELAKHANEMASMIKDAFVQAGFELYIDSYTNQQFPIIPNGMLVKFEKKYLTSVWCPYDDNHTVIRFVTSWATDKNKVEELVEDIKIIKG